MPLVALPLAVPKLALTAAVEEPDRDTETWTEPALGAVLIVAAAKSSDDWVELPPPRRRWAFAATAAGDIGVTSAAAPVVASVDVAAVVVASAAVAALPVPDEPPPHADSSKVQSIRPNSASGNSFR